MTLNFMFGKLFAKFPHNDSRPCKVHFAGLMAAINACFEGKRIPKDDYFTVRNMVRAFQKVDNHEMFTFDNLHAAAAHMACASDDVRITVHPMLPAPRFSTLVKLEELYDRFYSDKN
nr:MAG TPA: hypothetical protein [Crassvirales sp.]